MRYDAVVVGAGAAGLAASQLLAAAGRRVVVLEATHRIGGRVWTEYPWGDDNPVEWGAQVIHDCHQAERLWPPSSYLRTKVYHRGSYGRRAEYRYLFEGRWVTNSQYRGRLSRALRGAAAMSGGNPSCSTVLDAMKGWASREQKVGTSEVQAVFAAHPSCLSASAVRNEQKRWGSRYRGDYRLTGPYESLLRKFTSSAPINLSDRVVRIVRRGSLARICTLSGTEYTSRHVILTLPLGALKAMHVEFDPPLSDAKASAIDRLGFGSVVKIAIRTTPFWSNLAYAASDDPMLSWWPAIPDAKTHAILMGWTAGAEAELLSTLTEKGRNQRIRRSLRSLFPGRGRVSTRNIKIKDWSKEPFTLGAYSHVPPGAEHCRSILATPERDWLQLAGEAVHHQFPTTVTGAVLSGRHAARWILGR